MRWTNIGRIDSRLMTVVVINLLSILGFGLIGVIIAYIRRKEADGTLWETHFTYIIRTFWIGFVGFAIGFATTMLYIGVLIVMLVGLWWLIRAINGLLKAIDDQPIRDPGAFLI